MSHSAPGKIMLAWSLIILVLAGCGGGGRTKAQISAHYKQDHDYESLMALVPELNLVMDRADVEDLLGAPGVCPLEGQCYHASDESVIVDCADENRVSHETCQSFPLILVVTYALFEKIEGSPRDRLVGIHIGPVGE